MRADDIELPHPCSIDLRERIAGASAEFHCDHCDRSVHVLSHMSEAEAARVLARRQRDNLCVAFLRAPDGRVHFRGEGQPLVPASRLAGPRMMLRASALALSMAACSSDDGGENVALGGAPPGVASAKANEIEGTSTAPEAAHAEIDDEQLMAVGGAPPSWDERQDADPLVDETIDETGEQAGAKPDLHVEFETLELLSSKQAPNRQSLLDTKVGRGGGLHILEIEYCVKENGRVADPKHVRGDRELARLYIREAARWQFRPHRVEGHATRVCTKQRIIVDLDEPA